MIISPFLPGSLVVSDTCVHLYVLTLSGSQPHLPGLLSYWLPLSVSCWTTAVLISRTTFGGVAKCLLQRCISVYTVSTSVTTSRSSRRQPAVSGWFTKLFWRSHFKNTAYHYSSKRLVSYSMDILMGHSRTPASWSADVSPASLDIPLLD